MSLLDQLPATRRALLTRLKAGPQTLGELAEALQVSGEAVRQQLLQLESAQLVEQAPSPERTGQAGRPATRYRLTSAGEHLFPKRYDELAVALIDAVAGLGPETLHGVLAKVAEARVAEWEPKLAGKSLEEKVEALRSLYLEADAFMEITRDGEDLLLYERNCPYLDVAMRRPGLCSVSVNVLTRLLGARVVREERFQAGHGRCVFRVKTGEKARPRGFAPEPDPAPPRSR